MYFQCVTWVFPGESLDISTRANCLTSPVGDIKRCTLSDGVGKQGWANKSEKGGIYCKKGGKCGEITTFFCIFTFEDEEVVWRGDLLTINTGY